MPGSTLTQYPRAPTIPPDAGRRGARRSEVKGEAAGRRTRTALSATPSCVTKCPHAEYLVVPRHEVQQSGHRLTANSLGGVKKNPAMRGFLSCAKKAQSFCLAMNLSNSDSAKRNHNTWSRWKLRRSA